MNKNCKIVAISMFKNESKTIKRMLDSIAPYVDCIILQNNGSVDGTDKIVDDFFTTSKIPGLVYEVEEGWVGFGWNRDHLIKTCQSVDHGCDWILKMDCDEVLEIDDGFDWSLLDNSSIQAFHIPAVSGTCIYYRAWMWNANLPWRFNHDTCHETIYCEIPEIGYNYSKFNLPDTFRQIGYNEGQSWSIPTKFVSDSLILEEKMIRENTILSDLYHFWYIGKSYFDAFKCSEFPLGESQQKEYARRCIYYFQEHLSITTKNDDQIDETAYNSLIYISEANIFLGNYQEAIENYKKAEKYAPLRNDHLIGLSILYQKLEEYDKMLECTSIMMHPERTAPFPKYISFIDRSMYHDGGTLVKELHDIAFGNAKKTSPFIINFNHNKRLFVVDNFYKNPDEIRNFALNNVEYKKDLRWYKGFRSKISYIPEGIKEVFESIIGQKIIKFEEYEMNGCFQLCKSEDHQVYHYDQQNWAAIIYLTPNAPLESGTRLHKSRINGTRHSREENIDFAFNGKFYDSTKFDVTDSVGNIYNRLIIMDAKCIHSAGPYFGTVDNDCRLTHLFFFD